IVKAFWEQEFAKYTDRFAAEATPAIQNKVGQFTSNPLIRNIIGQPKSSLDFRKAMDEKKIVIMNLSKGRIGELNSNLLGAMLITKIYLASMSRATEPEKDFPDFYLYVDEFQNFAAESFKDILSESRKYGLALILAHQYIAQMPEGVSDAVFGNVGTHVVFRVGPADAQILEVEFTPEFLAEDIVNLGLARTYLKLSIDGVPSRPFSATTLPPIAHSGVTFKEEIKATSQKNYCNSKKDVEDTIAKWHEPIQKEKKVDGDKTASKEEVLEPTSPKLFEADCSVCGDKTVVPFEPDGKRPIYCKKHRAYATESQPKSSIPTPSPAPTPKPQPKTDESSVQKIKEKEYLSLRSLGKKKTGFGEDKNFQKRKEKSTPDFKGLRELLADVKSPGEGEKEGEEIIENKEKPLSPGDTIKF
ncbi:CxxC-x17-CxxC domain-containing protein, partial [Patescibacteria group bacterium]